MDRKGQLRNVAFGGDWAELIDPQERLAEALSMIDQAVRRTIYEDLRDDPMLSEAVILASGYGTKGRELSEAWGRALGIGESAQRKGELQRIARLFRTGSAVG